MASLLLHKFPYVYHFHFVSIDFNSFKLLWRSIPLPIWSTYWSPHSSFRLALYYWILFEMSRHPFCFLKWLCWFLHFPNHFVQESFCFYILEILQMTIMSRCHQCIHGFELCFHCWFRYLVYSSFHQGLEMPKYWHRVPFCILWAVFSTPFSTHFKLHFLFLLHYHFELLSRHPYAHFAIWLPQLNSCQLSLPSWFH